MTHPPRLPSNETTQIKNNDLKPCRLCGGELGGIFFQYFEHCAAVDPSKVNMLMGTAQILGGHMGIAQAMSTDSVASRSTEPMSSWFCCNGCRATRILPLLGDER